MTLEDLINKSECHDLLVRLCAAIDSGRTDDLPDFFTEDLTLCPPNGEVITGDEARATLVGRPKTIVTRHLMTNVIITPTGPGAARGEANILIYRVPPVSGGPLILPRTPQAAGDWVMDFRKTPSGWRVSRYVGIERMVPA